MVYAEPLFPHSAYPVEMTMIPYPVPRSGAGKSVGTPWTVQSLWWHYLCTMDAGFLEKRAFRADSGSRAFPG